jgi:radical SAM superfamily enzyme YgiQ (UPF0313 family)
LGINYIWFTDDTITAFPKRTKQLCSYLIQKGYQFGWECFSRVDIADRELVRLLARAGCKAIQFGFEAGNDAILESINKKATTKQMEEAVKLYLEFSIIPHGNFMVGFPDDTRETIRDTVNFAKKLKRIGAECDIAALTPFPGTYFYENAEKLGIQLHSDNWDDFVLHNPIISTRNLSLDELRSIHSEIRMELYHSN